MFRFIFTIVLFGLVNFSLFCGSNCSRNCSNSCKSCKSSNGGNKNIKKSVKLGLGRRNAVDWDSLCNFRDTKIEEDNNNVLTGFFSTVGGLSKDEKVTYFNNIADILRKSKIGFCNVGSTCYLNSALQALLRCKEFIVSFLNVYSENYNGIDDEYKEFYKAFLYLILKVKNAVDSGEKCLDSGVMKYVIGCFGRSLNVAGGLFTQNDSGEFITYFLDNMSTFMYCVTELFMFKNFNTTICTKGHNSESCENANFLAIPLSENGPNSIKECIDSENFYELEEGEYAYCNMCSIESIHECKYFDEVVNIFSGCPSCKKYSQDVDLKLVAGEYKKINDGKNLIFKCDCCGLVFDKNCQKCSGNHTSYCESHGFNQCEGCYSALCSDCKKKNNNLEYCRSKLHKAYCDKHYNEYYSGRKRSSRVGIKDTRNKYILISLKRYVKDRKINIPVNVDDKITFDGVDYKIRAVIVQSGCLDGGHYYSYVDVGDGDDSEWYEFDDSSVSKKTDEGEKKGYLFLYERCDN